MQTLVKKVIDHLYTGLILSFNGSLRCGLSAQDLDETNGTNRSILFEQWRS